MFESGMYHTGFQQHFRHVRPLFRSARSSDQKERMICSVKILYVGDSVIDKGRDAGFWMLYFNHPRAKSDRFSPIHSDG